MQLLEEASAVLRRRFAGPAPERAVERGRVGEGQEVRDLADAQRRIAEVLEGEISEREPSIVPFVSRRQLAHRTARVVRIRRACPWNRTPRSGALCEGDLK